MTSSTFISSAAYDFILFYKSIFILESFIEMLHGTHPRSVLLCTVDAFLSNSIFLFYSLLAGDRLQFKPN